MTKRRQELTLPLAPDDVAQVILDVSRDLGWSVAPATNGGFEIREDATKLHCHCTPLRVRLMLSATTEGTTLTIDGEVPGWGPIASQHAREQTDLLTRKLGLAAIVDRGRASI